MLLKVTPEGYKNMAVVHYYEMTQFLTNIILPDTDNKVQGSIRVDYVSPKGPKVNALDIPLQPSTQDLETVEVTMHRSSTKTFKMPASYNDWFSKCFGYEVVLAYLGPNRRDVLFEDLKPKNNTSILSKIAGNLLTESEPYNITFADCAPYLIVSKTSLADVSARLPEGEEMDITKFRPNIVVVGAKSPWEEDYWGGLHINGADLRLAHNCVRCKSINVDYQTGEQAAGEAGEMLKKLQKDRRVDKGSKWSPVFGRYSYWDPKCGARTIKVGDDVAVTKFNRERTTWSKCFLRFEFCRYCANGPRLERIISAREWKGNRDKVIIIKEASSVTLVSRLGNHRVKQC
jgi:uncharacterized protein YcbX